MMTGCDDDRVDRLIKVDLLLVAGAEREAKFHSRSMGTRSTGGAQPHQGGLRRLHHCRNECPLRENSSTENSGANLCARIADTFAMPDFYQRRRAYLFAWIADQDSKVRGRHASSYQLIRRNGIFDSKRMRNQRAHVHLAVCEKLQE